MNTLLQGLTEYSSQTYTENGARTYASTMNGLVDLFALGGAYRARSDEDIILLFEKAYRESPLYALRCLFYLYDIRKGQGERRFFRVVVKYLARKKDPYLMKNLYLIPFYGRWDMMFEFIDTPFEKSAFKILKKQLLEDINSYQKNENETVSLCAKWCFSENASSKESKRKGKVFREFLGWTPKQYRITLSRLRQRINIIERLMSENRWDEIKFEQVPSKAGIKYRNAFARHDAERVAAGVNTYEDFIRDENTHVHADTLYPYEVVNKAIGNKDSVGSLSRETINKYWDNLKDWFKGQSFNGLAVVDTSASMLWGIDNICPMDIAISLGLYCADKAQGPFADHYISFSQNPRLVKTEGVDFVDKVHRIFKTNLCQNTNIEGVFTLILNTALTNQCLQSELPENIIVISDMEFDSATTDASSNYSLMENIKKRWEDSGYKMPNLIFWNVNARTNNIPMKMRNGITFVSGFSPSIFQQIMSGKSALDLVLDVLNSERYSLIK